MTRRSIAALLIVAILCLLGACTKPAEEKTYTVQLDESSGTWSYLMDPEGIVREVSNTADLSNGNPTRTWVFEGVGTGETKLIFFDGVSRTVRCTLFVDEQRGVSELAREDTIETEDMVMEAVAAILENQYRSGAQYPATGDVPDAYAVNYLQAYANLFRTAGAQEYPDIQDTGYDQYISLDEAQVDAILDVAFGGRYTTEDLPVDGKTVIFNAHAYYIGVQDVVEISASAGNETGSYVYTVMTDTENIDGVAKVTLKASDKNPSGYTISGLQTN